MNRFSARFLLLLVTVFCLTSSAFAQKKPGVIAVGEGAAKSAKIAEGFGANVGKEIVSKSLGKYMSTTAVTRGTTFTVPMAPRTGVPMPVPSAKIQRAVAKAVQLQIPFPSEKPQALPKSQRVIHPNPFPGVREKSSLRTVANGYARINSNRFAFKHPATAEAMTAIVIDHDTWLLEDGYLLKAHSVVIKDAAGVMQRYNSDYPMPKDLQAAVDKARFGDNSLLNFEFATPMSSGPKTEWKGALEYRGQGALAADIVRLGGKGRAFKSSLYGEGVAYEIPSYNILYRPEGRAARLLDPQQDIVVFLKSSSGGYIIQRAQLEQYGQYLDK